MNKAYKQDKLDNEKSYNSETGSEKSMITKVTIGLGLLAAVFLAR